MSQNMTDIDNAVRAVQDPLTSADDLALIAYYHPSLRAAAAAHLNAYPATRANIFGTWDPNADHPTAQPAPAPVAPPVSPVPWDTPPVWPLLPLARDQDVSEPSRDPEPSIQPLPTYKAPNGRLRAGLALVVAATVVVAAAGLIAGGYPYGEVPPLPPVDPVDVPPGLVSVQVFGGSNDDKFSGVVVAPDGTIAVVGDTHSTDGDFPADTRKKAAEAGIMGVSDGDIGSLSFVAGVENGASLWGVAATEESDLIVTGSTSGNLRPFVAKRTATGETVWHADVGDASHGGGLAVSGDRSVTANLVGPNQLVRFSPDGEVLWTKDVADALGDGPYVITAAQDNGVVAAAPFGPNGAWDCRIVKFDASGKIEWTKRLSNSGAAYPEAVTFTPEGNIVLAGWTDSSDGDFANLTPGAFVAQLTKTGDLVWVQSIGLESSRFKAIAVNEDTIAAVGYVENLEAPEGTARQQGLLTTFELDGTLREIWAVGDSGTVQLLGVGFKPDGGYLVAGLTTATDGDWQAIHGGADAVIAEFA